MGGGSDPTLSSARCEGRGKYIEAAVGPERRSCGRELRQAIGGHRRPAARSGKLRRNLAVNVNAVKVHRGYHGNLRWPRACWRSRGCCGSRQAQSAMSRQRNCAGEASGGRNRRRAWVRPRRRWLCLPTDAAAPLAQARLSSVGG